MNWEMVWGFARHILTFGGGFLVADGVLDAEMLNSVIGAVGTIGGVVWSIIAKRNAAAPVA